jgi:hypothetical protein
VLIFKILQKASLKGSLFLWHYFLSLTKLLKIRRFFLFITALFFTLSISAQVDPGSGALGTAGMFIQTGEGSNELKGNGYTQDEIKVILKKKYLTQVYNPAYVDDFNQVAYLRYNLYEDQMEFVKDEVIYFLKKDLGREVQFSILSKNLYKIYELNGRLHFFLVPLKGKNSLLIKQSVRFVESKKATTTYGKDKKADFKRKKDELYLALDDSNLIKIPTRKKEFYSIFGSNGNVIKTYMKKNKLGYKKVKDLKKIIAYYNTL